MRVCVRLSVSVVCAVGKGMAMGQSNVNFSNFRTVALCNLPSRSAHTVLAVCHLNVRRVNPPRCLALRVRHDRAQRLFPEAPGAAVASFAKHALPMTRGNQWATSRTLLLHRDPALPFLAGGLTRGTNHASCIAAGGARVHVCVCACVCACVRVCVCAVVRARIVCVRSGQV